MASEKTEDVKDKVVSAGTDAKSEVEGKVEDAKKGSEPSKTDQAKGKYEETKEGAKDTQSKVTSSLAEGWNKTKETISNVNQYPDKK